MSAQATGSPFFTSSADTYHNPLTTSLLNNYKRFPIYFTKGRGVFLWDANKKKYLDMLSGISVNNLGHAHSSVIRAIKTALKHPLHVSNLFGIESQEKLATQMQQMAQYQGKSFFCNSGTEANEAAYKWMLVCGKSHHAEKIEVLAAENSFHGRTTASLSLTGRSAYRQPFLPLLPNIRYFKYNDINSFKKVIGKNTAGVFLELVQGEGGVYPIDEKFLHQVRTLCNEMNALLFIDEVQTGCFRTGNFCAFNGYHNLHVDGFTMAKALGNGVPIGVFTLHEKWTHLIKPGQHGSTFGGNPFAATVASAVLSMYQQKKFIKHLNNLMTHFNRLLLELKQSCFLIKEVRCMGMMAGIEIKSTLKQKNKENFIAQVVDECLQHGLIVGGIDNKIIRMLPPLVANHKHLNDAFNILTKVLQNITQHS